MSGMMNSIRSTSAAPSGSSKEEAGALRPLDGQPPFLQVRDLIRRVGSDCCIEVDTNAYSVPWRLIGETVRAVLVDRALVRRYGGIRRISSLATV